VIGFGSRDSNLVTRSVFGHMMIFGHVIGFWSCNWFWSRDPFWSSYRFLVTWRLLVTWLGFQRRQSGLISGGSWIQVKGISIFPGKFPKNFDFSGNF